MRVDNHSKWRGGLVLLGYVSTEDPPDNDFFFLNPYISYLRKLTVTTVGQSVGESFAAQR